MQAALASKGDDPVFTCGKPKSATVSSILTDWLNKSGNVPKQIMSEEEEKLHHFIEQNLSKSSELYRKARALLAGKHCREDLESDHSSHNERASAALITPLPPQICGSKRALSSIDDPDHETADRLSTKPPTTECESSDSTDSCAKCACHNEGSALLATLQQVKDNSTSGVRREQVGKRTDVIQWDDYFMAVAFLSAMRSKDPSTQVGACLVNPDKRIVGIGYNGFPRGCSDDELPWCREAENDFDTKYPYVCHAEVNAILNKNSAEAKNCSIYVALFPCNECAKMIIQSGISEVVYLSDKYKEKSLFKASRRLLNMAGVKLRMLQPKARTLTIDYNSIV